MSERTLKLLHLFKYFCLLILTMNIVCKGCGKEKEHHGKGFCYNCYRKLSWLPQKKICKRCGREMPIHAKDVCPGCYTTLFRLQYNKDWNNEKRHNINVEICKNITKKCVICGFDKIVDLHHIDRNRKNNSKDNLIGLCPNHHKMIHHLQFKGEINNILKEKGQIK
jgi:hypothetical protein